MKVKFNNGIVLECSEPTEQKAFKLGKPAGWILNFRVFSDLNSAKVDELVSDENISNLVFTSHSGEDSTAEKSITLSGYSRVSSVSIRHSKEVGKSEISIQLIKGS